MESAREGGCSRRGFWGGFVGERGEERGTKLLPVSAVAWLGLRLSSESHTQHAGSIWVGVNQGILVLLSQ